MEKNTTHKILNTLYWFFICLLFTHCGHDEGQGRPAPTVEIECDSLTCPVDAIVQVYWVKEDCELALSAGNYYFSSAGTINSNECSGDICRKYINTWTKKGETSTVSKFPERTYVACAFVDSDESGVIEVGAGDYTGSVTTIELSKEPKVHKIEVITGL